MTRLNSQKSSLSSFGSDSDQLELLGGMNRSCPRFAARGINSYRQTEIQSRTPLELVVMLYDGALRFTADARDAIVRRDIRARQQHLSRALAIVSELQSTLDMEAGGRSSRSISTSCTDSSAIGCMDASSKQDVKPLDEARRVLTTLREGWLAISRASAAATTASAQR